MDIANYMSGQPLSSVDLSILLTLMADYDLLLKELFGCTSCNVAGLLDIALSFLMTLLFLHIFLASHAGMITLPGIKTMCLAGNHNGLPVLATTTCTPISVDSIRLSILIEVISIWLLQSMFLS